MKDSTSDSLLVFSRRHSVAGPTLKKEDQFLQQNRNGSIQPGNVANDQGILLSSLEHSIDELVQTQTVNKTPTQTGTTIEIASSSSNTTASTIATKSSSSTSSSASISPKSPITAVAAAKATAATPVSNENTTTTVTPIEKSSVSPVSSPKPKSSASTTTTPLNTKKDLYAKVAASAIADHTHPPSLHPPSSSNNTFTILPLQQSISTPTTIGSNFTLPKGDDMGKGIKLELIPKEARFFVVEFKAGRSDVFYSILSLKKNDLVMVEADRGHDLGKITIDNMNFLQFMKYIQQKQSSTSSFIDITASPSLSLLSSTTTTANYSSQKGKEDEEKVKEDEKEKDVLEKKNYNNNNDNNDSDDDDDRQEQKKQLDQFLQQQREMRIKRLFRLARQEEINVLIAKDQDEQKALATCQQKVQQRKLNISVVNAEYQWDRHKLTFYFVADRRVDFRELVRELFKLYKTRIWMCDVNAEVKK
ncbi:PSP1 C-terminal conserved region-domain-containing protein [Cunninghamella echinulata]|nr:PSP1 C-terminal conserved region-domain-containing protein [Cunninghamella echinulata]